MTRPLASALACTSFTGLLLLILGGCAPLTHPPGAPISAPTLTLTHFIAEDGTRLRYRAWLPEEAPPDALVIALHGFNDYSRFFTGTGAFLSRRGIGSYAYDQRGFGDSTRRGLWAGTKAYADDLHQFTGLVARRHPGTPIYWLGESMGGAVMIVAATGDNPPPVDGIILAAPAVWGRHSMPWYQRLLLWVAAHSVPWLTVTGEGLEIAPSDNIEMLRALGRDPMVIKATRIDAIHGLVDLMDCAFERAARLNTPALLLYGEKDEIIPKPATVSMLIRMPQPRGSRKRFAFYENGYHMLLRDTQAEMLWNDIESWIEHPQTPLPSGADQHARSALAAARRQTD